MAATLACANCGAEGEANFSANYFGELVCELCGTQSYLQNRTETQEAEDMGIDIATISKLKRRSTRQKRGRKIKAERKDTSQAVQLLDCIVTTQFILNEQAEALVRLGFPPEYPRVVRDVWFHLLQVWQQKGARPLLRCFTEFHYQRRAADKTMDPAVTNDVLEQWDAENGSNLEKLFTASQSTETPVHPERSELEIGPTSVPGETKNKRTRDWMHTLDWLVLPDLIGVLVLAGRMLNVAALPCDYSYWIQCGDLPYYNLLSKCPLAMQEKVERVAVFFDATIRTNWISTAVIAYRTHYLQFHLEMRVPPLNASLIAFNICENLHLPPPVYRHFQWISAQFNIAGALPEKPLKQKGAMRYKDPNASALDSGAGIAAYLLAAIRLCPNWSEWIYETVPQRDQHMPPYSAVEADRLPRRELSAFVEFCEETLLGKDRGRIPEEFTSHVDDLKTSLSVHKAPYFSHTYESHALRAYPPEYEDGVCVETTDEIQKRVARIKTQHGIRSGMADEKMDLIDEDRERTVKPTLFYPLYSYQERSSFHAPFEAALELVAEYIDCPMGLVMKWVDVIDRGLRERAPEFIEKQGRLIKRTIRGANRRRAPQSQMEEEAKHGEEEEDYHEGPTTILVQEEDDHGADRTQPMVELQMDEEKHSIEVKI